MQAIHKQCPYCPAIFRVRTALEAHLAGKHADRPRIADVAQLADNHQAHRRTTAIRASPLGADLVLGDGGGGWAGSSDWASGSMWPTNSQNNGTDEDAGHSNHDQQAVSE